MKRLLLLFAVAVSARAACVDRPFIPNGVPTTPFTSGVAILNQTIAFADFNGDGITDVVALHGPFDGTALMLFGTSSGRLIPHPVAIDAPATNVLAADFNGDGRSDLVFSDETTFIARLSLGGGTFTDGHRVVFAGNGDRISAMAAGDFDGDGHTDLLIAGAKGLTLYSGHGDATFTRSTFLPAPQFRNQLVVADFDGDGKLDVAMAGFTDAVIAVARGNGDGSFTITQQKTLAYDPAIWQTSIAAADFDGDGRLDLAVADAAGLRVLPGGGAATFGDGVLDPINWLNLGTPYHLVAADLDGDGRPDLVAAASQILVFRNLGGQFGGPEAVNRGRKNTEVGVFATDVDGDGMPDLIALDYDGFARTFINPCRTPVILRAPTDAVVAGDPIDLKVYDATGAAAIPTTFRDGMTVIGSGNGSLTTSLTAAGHHALIATTSEGTTFPLIVSVHAQPSAITFANVKPHSAYGEGIHLSGTVTTDTGEMPQFGNVEIVSGATVLASVPVTNGAWDVVLNPPPGTYSLSARYAGAGPWPRSDASPGVQHVVDVTTVTMSIARSTAASICQPPIIPLLAGRWGLSIKAGAAFGIPTGTVTLRFPQFGFVDTEDLVDGVAGFGFSRVPGGTYAFTATYSGDAGYPPAQFSGTVTVPDCHRRAIGR